MYFVISVIFIALGIFIISYPRLLAKLQKADNPDLAVKPSKIFTAMMTVSGVVLMFIGIFFICIVVSGKLTLPLN